MKMVFTCKHCNAEIKKDRALWVSARDVAPQYCWIDPMHGSQLHEPVAAMKEIWLVARFGGAEVARIYIAQYTNDEELELYQQNGSPKKDQLARILPFGCDFHYIVVDTSPAATFVTEAASEVVEC